MIYTSFDNVGLVRILSLLKSHNAEYLSGQDLSDVLKISRVAVWKHIKRIRSLGYKIESKQKLGYKLVGNTELLLPWEIIDGLKTDVIGKRVYYFDDIDSTQNFASSIAKTPRENGTVIVSKKQSSGKGRLGRKWVSPDGGLWFSVILHPKFDVSLATLFPLAASLALANAIEKTLKKKPELKWPNDVTLNHKKVAGMLVDLSLKSNDIESLILGVGINFKIDPIKLEKTIKNTRNFYGVATLVKKNEDADPIKLMQSFLFELEKICEELNQGNIRKTIKEWTKMSATIGKKATVSTSSGKISGKAIRIDDDGALVISQAKETHRVLVGDVS
ncbi:MAG: biotin--acetyl-CoA-carboxylase ligase [Thaumarchaeota archaeon CSP1-1]|nr:MAG: biotin--acetyl-CoA-carboxylase ligase [Thaumarchaeota archaeon CSP1-1]